VRRRRRLPRAVGAAALNAAVALALVRAAEVVVVAAVAEVAALEPRRHRPLDGPTEELC